MAPQYILWPTVQEREDIKRAFELYSGFPGIVGCINGTHNPIIAPIRQKLRYRNRHHAYSMNTQVVCDHKLLIRDVYIGEAGSMPDQRVLRRSPLFNKLINPEEDFMLPDEHLIGDGGYTLLDTLLKPFRNVGHLSEEQRLYNRLLCRSRGRIEHTHGKSFNQWRRMKYLHCINLDLAVDHIMSCFVLHNFMILNGEVMMDLEDLQEENERYLDDGPHDNEEEDDEVEGEEEEGNPEFNQRLREARENGIEKRWHVVFTL